MKARTHGGAVVPVVTPVTANGDLDEAALARLIDFQLEGGVEGIFVLGTTGEGPSVPRAARLRLVQQTVTRVAGRALVYAGIGDTCWADSLRAGNDYLRAGVDAVVAQPPGYYPLQPHELLAYFRKLLAEIEGPLVLYNIPQTTRTSIPLDVLEALVGHPRLVGFKDSENDEMRLEALLARFGAVPDFAIFIGVGALMAKGLLLGAEGIVPSVGNLIPETCHDLCASMARKELPAAEGHAMRMAAVTELYQKGRSLGASLAALKAALHLKGLCGPHMLPPLLPLAETEWAPLRQGLQQLQVL